GGEGQRWKGGSGAESGYRYDGSPLIASERGEPPPIDFIEYRPITWPGARLPHAWLADGTAVQDRIGYDLAYTLLRLGGAGADVSALARAVSTPRAPLPRPCGPRQGARAIYACGPPPPPPHPH